MTDVSPEHQELERRLSQAPTPILVEAMAFGNLLSSEPKLQWQVVMERFRGLILGKITPNGVRTKTPCNHSTGHRLG